MLILYRFDKLKHTLSMCGIFAYSGKKNAGDIIVEGLKRLEYRGYDSWGIALLHQNHIKVTKKVGPIGDLTKLKNLPFCNLGIGHTRWATHGNVNETNAHPHFSTNHDFVVAQNGIVENYQELKKNLIKQNFQFSTQTDTEVIVRQIEKELLKTKNIQTATQQAFLKLKGRNTIIVLTQAGQMIAIRHGSPLVAGLGNKEIILASDTLSFANLTNKAVFIDDWQMVSYFKNKVRFFDLKKNREIFKKPITLQNQEIKLSKNGHDSFYFKEVLEQPQTIKNAVIDKTTELKPFLQALEKAKHIYTLGAGSASFAAGQGAYYFRKLNKLVATELKAYEIKSYLDLFSKNDVLIAVSQSGETADTLEAISKAKKSGVKIASIVNMIGSTLSRESDFAFYTRSGPEISVVSTKAFTAQITWFLYISYCLNKQEVLFKKHVEQTAKKISNYQQLKYLKKMADLAKTLVNKKHVYVLGRDHLFYIASEAAMKIKEISYIHAEAFSSGELKHGVIALIDKHTPVIGLISKHDQAEMLSALSQVKARGATVIGVSCQNNDLFDNWLEVPDVEILEPVAQIIPIQILGYYLAKFKHLSPDKPRNLAKSVTVK